jgi:hypothetical protein
MPQPRMESRTLVTNRMNDWDKINTDLPDAARERRNTLNARPVHRRPVFESHLDRTVR